MVISLTDAGELSFLRGSLRDDASMPEQSIPNENKCRIKPTFNEKDQEIIPFDDSEMFQSTCQNKVKEKRRRAAVTCFAYAYL